MIPSPGYLLAIQVANFASYVNTFCDTLIQVNSALNAQTQESASSVTSQKMKRWSKARRNE